MPLLEGSEIYLDKYTLGLKLMGAWRIYSFDRKTGPWQFYVLHFKINALKVVIFERTKIEGCLVIEVGEELLDKQVATSWGLNKSQIEYSSPTNSTSPLDKRWPICWQNNASSQFHFHPQCTIQQWSNLDINLPANSTKEFWTDTQSMSMKVDYFIKENILH